MSRLPAAFLARLEEQFGTARAAAILQADAHPRWRTVRVNTLRCTVTEAQHALAAAGIPTRPSRFAPEALVPETVVDASVLQSLEAHARGWLHVQSLPSIAAGSAVQAQPGESVLDLCAAPGSKTSHLAACMRNEGRLVANELSRARMFRLRSVLAHLGAAAEVHVGPGESWGRRSPAAFDRVLVDAPCSGEGRFREDEPGSYEDWSPKKVQRLSSLQKSLLHSALDAVRPGGLVVYSTCTFAPEENEEVLARALVRYEDRVRVEPLPFALPGSEPARTAWRKARFPDEITHARRCVPDPDASDPDVRAMEGFFVACLRRRA